MARTGTVTLNLTICTDLDCIRAGHPDHTTAQVEWPSGRIEYWPEFQDRLDARLTTDHAQA